MSTGNLSGFDAGQHEPNSFDVLPAGEYEIVIVSSEDKISTSSGNKYLALTMQVLNGPHQNRKLFDNLNIWHPDQQTKSIALGTLSAICRAVGVLNPNDSSELHNKPLRCKVTITNDPSYGQQNKVRGYKSRTAQPASAPTLAAAGGQPWPQPEAPTLQEAQQRF